MFGIIVATHDQMAEEIKNIVEIVMGKQGRFEAIGLFEGESLERMSEKIKNAVVEMQVDNTIIFVDMRGATPNNSALLVLSEIQNIKIITGVNLPMVLEAVALRETNALKEIDALVDYLVKTGRESINTMALN